MAPTPSLPAREGETQDLEMTGGAQRRRVSPTLAGTVMAITKCRIWARPVNPFTVATTALRQCVRTGDGWPAPAKGERHEQDQRHLDQN